MTLLTLEIWQVEIKQCVQHSNGNDHVRSSSALVKITSISLAMAGNVTKWRLNKTETKQLDDETKAFYDAQIAAGMDKKDAQKERDNFYDKRSKELKSLKAAKSASKKAEQKKTAPEVGVPGKDDVAMGPDFNSHYYVIEAKKVKESCAVRLWKDASPTWASR